MPTGPNWCCGWRRRTVLADQGYHRHALYDSIRDAKARSRLVIASEEAGRTTFVPQRKRWLVERTFSWLRSSRLLAREYEGGAVISRSNVYLRNVMFADKQVSWP